MTPRALKTSFKAKYGYDPSNWETEAGELLPDLGWPGLQKKKDSKEKRGWGREPPKLGFTVLWRICMNVTLLFFVFGLVEFCFYIYLFCVFIKVREPLREDGSLLPLCMYLHASMSILGIELRS